MILIAYDGSEDSKTAIATAGRLFPGAEATVLCVWEPFIDMMLRYSTMGAIGGVAGLDHADEIDEATGRAALARATEGVQAAIEAGLVAKPLTEARSRTVPTTILECGDELDAAVIVMGTRGLSGVKSVVLGSVSHHVAQHADRPVLIVPSVAMAKDRRDQRQAAVPAP